MQSVVAHETAPHPENVAEHFVYIDELMGKGNLEFVGLEIGVRNEVGKAGSNVGNES